VYPKSEDDTNVVRHDLPNAVSNSSIS